MDSKVNTPGQGILSSWLIDGIKVDLSHSSKINDLPKKKNALFLGRFSKSLVKKKEVNWFYSVDSDYVIIKAGDIVIKSKIHDSEGFNFIRVPRLGLVLVEDNLLRKPKTGEEAIISRNLFKK